MNRLVVQRLATLQVTALLALTACNRSHESSSPAVKHSSSNPWPDGFDFPSLKARVEWRAGVLASGKMDDATRQSVERGRALFTHEFTVEEGLGPYYSQRSCMACHSIPGVGGRGVVVNAANVYGRGDKAAFGDMYPLAGVRFLPHQVLPGYPPYAMPGDFVFFGKRVPPSLLGIGWIEAIPAQQILAGKHCPDPDAPLQGVCGWAPKKETGAGSLRFGVKLVTATIDEFVANAFFEEIGLTTLTPQGRSDADKVPDPEISEDQIIDVANYVAFAPPPAVPLAPEHAAGAAVFRRVGCADCHSGTFTVNGAPVPQMYTDLLAHDLGPALAETRRTELTPAGHFRTAALWGLRNFPGPYLRDGSAATLDEAILKHGGEATASRAAFSALSPADHVALLAMLHSL